MTLFNFMERTGVLHEKYVWEGDLENLFEKDDEEYPDLEGNPTW